MFSKPVTLVLTSLDRICKPEVEIVPQTGSTNILATETDIDAISKAIPMFFGGLVFHWFICQPHPTLPARWSSIWRTDTGSSYNLVMENDINVISAAAAMFSGMRNPLPWVSTLYDFGKHHNAQTGSSNNSETETDIDAISGATTMFWSFQVRLRSNRRSPTSENSVRCKHPVLSTVSTSGLYLMLFSKVGYCQTDGNVSGVP